MSQPAMYQPGDHLAIGRIFYDAVHQLAAADYTEAQRNAWAPPPEDRVHWSQHWEQRCARKQPFVVRENIVEINGERLLNYLMECHLSAGPRSARSSASLRS